ncbi:hypothetical protein BDN72DRAFT_881179 [Pluteus cervinus]|uniref:Uncharacterized protein n=1 Tax=Pluteus cervinus TaxID=181527 RepID=A0ACD3AHI3_9AGAR|nr:hypothetical protein BDN72DRAFT_881179 [Pluteus cervinus]
MPRWQISSSKTSWAALLGSQSSPAASVIPPPPPTTTETQVTMAPVPDRGGSLGVIATLALFAALALFITQATQVVRANKDDYKLLAKDVVLLQDQVREAFGSAMDEFVPAMVQPLISLLEDTKEFTKKTTKRNVFTRIVKKRADLDAIETFRERLQKFQAQLAVQSINNNVKDLKWLLTNPVNAREKVILSSSGMDGVGVSGAGSHTSGPTTVNAGVETPDIQLQHVEDPQGTPQPEAPVDVFPSGPEVLALERPRTTESSSSNGGMSSTTDSANSSSDLRQTNPFYPNFVPSPLPRTAPASLLALPTPPLMYPNCDVPSSSNSRRDGFMPPHSQYQGETHHLYPYPAADCPYRHDGHFSDSGSLDLSGVQTIPPSSLWPSTPTSMAGSTPPLGTGQITLPLFDMRRARINGTVNVNVVMGSSAAAEMTSGDEPKRSGRWIDNANRRAIRRKMNRRL